MKHILTNIKYSIRLINNKYEPENFKLTDTIKCIHYNGVHLCNYKPHIEREQKFGKKDYTSVSDYKYCEIIIADAQNKKNANIKILKSHKMGDFMRIDSFFMVNGSDLDLNVVIKHILHQINCNSEYVINSIHQCTRTYKYDKNKYNIAHIDKCLKELKDDDYEILNFCRTINKKNM